MTPLSRSRRADLAALLEGDIGETGIDSTRDLTVEEVADETGREPSTVRGWLISKALRVPSVFGFYSVSGSG